MSATYEVVKYRPEHKARVVELQRDLWSSDPSLNAAYLEWKYERNPYVDGVPIYLARSAGEIVAMRGFFGSVWEAGLSRQEVVIHCADDLVIAAAHRNRGVFTLMMRAAFDDLRTSGAGVSLTLSGGPATVLGSLTMGWKSIGQTLPARWVSGSARRVRWIHRYASALPVLRRIVTWLPDPAPLERFAHLDAQAAATSPSAGPVWLAREARPEAMAALVERLGTDGRIRHVRDAKYFAWRFGNPLNEYRFLFAGADKLAGYMVLRRCVSDRFDRTRVHVADWEGVDGTVKKQLLQAAIEWGNFAELMTWTATVPAETVRILRDAGFSEPVLSPRGMPCVLVKSIGTGANGQQGTIAGKALLDPASWDWRMLYSMQG